MNSISHGLPNWAQPKVAQFLDSKTSPIEGAQAQALAPGDAGAHQSLIDELADRLIVTDGSAQDLDKRDGFIQKNVFNSGLTEDVRYRKDGSSYELAYDFGDGHHAQYMVSDDEKAVLVDIAQGDHTYNMAVFVDKKDPSKSVLFAKES
jgi:hypothetical protein